jgi:hypothetical protein
MRYGTDVDNAIREAFATGMRFSDAFRKLKAGTLPGLAGPVAMPERTFSYKWSAVKKAQRQAAEPEPSGPSILDRAFAVAARERRFSDLGVIARCVGMTPQQLREWFDAHDERGREQARRIAPSESLVRIERGKAMIYEGASLEEAAQAMEMPVGDARLHAERWLADRAEMLAIVHDRLGSDG